MATEGSQQRALQEKSIKARKHELFVGETNDVGPQKTFRQVLSETPAAPMTKNVKMILLGTTAPVLLLFVVALHAAGSTSRAKAPEGPIIASPVQVTTTQVVKVTPAKPAASPAAELKPDEPKPDAPPKPVAKKAKKPSKKKAKPKPKDDAAIAENTDKKSDEPKPDDAPKTASTDDSKSKSNSKDAKNKSSASGSGSGSGPGSTVVKPPKRTTSVFKKPPKPPNFAYPKKGTEKKDDADKSDSTPGSEPGFP